MTETAVGVDIALTVMLWLLIVLISFCVCWLGALMYKGIRDDD